MTTPLPLDHDGSRRKRKLAAAENSQEQNAPRSSGFFVCPGDLDNARRSLLAAFLHASAKEDLTVRRFSLEEKDNRLEIRYLVEGGDEARAFFCEVMNAARDNLS